MAYKISLIIPTYNKLSRLKLMLCSLEHVHGIEDAEIIIVNDGSVDGTKELLQKYQSRKNFKILHGQNRGRSASRNWGVKEASSEIIVFSDDDLLIHPDFLAEHWKIHQCSSTSLIHGCIFNLPFVKFFADPSQGIMIENYKNREGLKKYIIREEDILKDLDKVTAQKRFGKFEKDIQNLFQQADENIDRMKWVCCTGGNISLKKELLLGVGGFDENLGRTWGCEDLELGYRLAKEKVEFKYHHLAINYHMNHYRSNAQAEHKNAFTYFYLKHQDEAILRLEDYFNGNIATLLEWKDIVIGK